MNHSSPYKIYTPLLAAMLLMMSGQWAQADAPAVDSHRENNMSGLASPPSQVDDSLLFLSYLTIAVATVDGVENKKWNEALPPLPTGELTIMEQLRGHVPTTVRFVPLLYGTKAYDSASVEKAMVWKGKPLTRFVGKQWIIISNGANVIDIYPYSEQSVRYVKSHMASQGLDKRIRIALLSVIVGLVFLPLAWAATLSRKLPMALLLLQCIAYAVYEWGMPGYENIRVDLMVIVPALLINGYRTLRLHFRQRSRHSATDA